MKHKPMGPFSPPLPTDVEANGPEPMAVARDKQQTHGESFGATSAPMDAFDHDVARRYRQVPKDEVREHLATRPPDGGPSIMPKSREEKTREAEHPTGHTAPDEDGWAHPDHDA